MEEIQAQVPVVVIGGIRYDASQASQEAGALIQDLATVQNELNKIKTSYDIANIARGTLLQSIAARIEAGDSGLVEIPTEDEETTDSASE
jgi:hypothetical protein